MLCDVLNASLLLNVTVAFAVSPTARKNTLLLLLFPCICMQQHYCTWALKYSTAEAQKAPIISPTHVFEGLEVSQLNAKQDLSGLSAGLRQFSLLLTLFQNWEHLNHKATDYSNVAQRVSLSRSGKPGPSFFFFFLESGDKQKASQLSIIIDVLSVH